MDAGNVVLQPPRRLSSEVRRSGFYSPYSAGTIQQWTHADSLRALGAGHDVLERRNLNGAIVGFSSRSDRAMQLLNDWAERALDVNCIAPTGSSCKNHRQDQAVLTVLAWQMGLVAEEGDSWIRAEVAVHRDID